MTEPVTISMVCITKNEAANIERCLSSFWDEVDEVVLCDTGSTDDTIEVAEEFAENRGEPDKLVIGHFDWGDDFAAARNYADSLSSGTWRSYIDLDDTVQPGSMRYLREMAEKANDDVAMFYVTYEYAGDGRGNVFSELWRERLVRASAGCEWIGRVHECTVGRGTLVRVEPEHARFVHHRDHSDIRFRDRNEKILRRWLEEEPNTPGVTARILSYLAYELMGSRVEVDGVAQPDRDKIREALSYFERYLEMRDEPADARAQAARRYSQCLLQLGKKDEAERVSLPMVAECPFWPDTYLTLAEVAHERGHWANVVDLAKQVLDRGKPDTLLIINPEDYSLRPKVLMASALSSQGRLEEACRLGKEVADVNPGFLGIAEQLNDWLGQLAREQAAQQWANSARLLYENDEPEKALALLETVPHFCWDHPAVVAMRVHVTAALREPYVVEQVKDSPRGQFLLRGLREQEKELAKESRTSATRDAELPQPEARKELVAA